MLDIVLKLRRIVEHARNGMPPVGVETLLEAAIEIEKLRSEAQGTSHTVRTPVEGSAVSLTNQIHIHVDAPKALQNTDCK